MNATPRRDFVVGLFVLAGLAAIGYLSLSLGGLSWNGKPDMRLLAAFDETGGLTINSPVVIAGVRVGDVSRISLGSDFRAKVELSLDPTLKLPTDTSASIVTAGVLGDRYIELQPGADDQILKSGDQITFTQPAVILEKLIGQFLYGVGKGDSKQPQTSPALHP